MSLIQKKLIHIFKAKNEIICVGSDGDSKDSYSVLIIDRISPDELLIDSLEDTQFDRQQIIQLLQQHGINKKSSNFNKAIKAHGIVGFVRFVAGFYMIVVTKYAHVGCIGWGEVFKVLHVEHVYINNSNIQNNIERKYEKLFKSVDLSTHFYFSYNYDLTNTYQYNIINKGYASKFVWNSFLLRKIRLNQFWTVNLIHGFYREYKILIYGMSLSIALLARRSSRFAGTRYLKRGCNARGNVANEVELEQIVTDLSNITSNGPKISSFVQVRGSVPLIWSQEYNNVGKRPPITVLRSDPRFVITARHYNKLLRRYGTPLCVLDLVKRNPKSDEYKLGYESQCAIKYLNQFLPPQFAIELIQFDMKNILHEEVLNGLRSIGKSVVDKTGFFCEGVRQCGVVRTNCIDTLDRTNIAQFAIGHYVLKQQLLTLSIFSDGNLSFDSIYSTTFEKLFDEIGDALSMQYAGSSIIHYIRHYYYQTDLISAATDIIPNISRYYSNTFTDKKKQAALNLFLGKHRPCEDHKRVFSSEDDSSDDYKNGPTREENEGKFYYDSAWFDRSMLFHFPRSPHEMGKIKDSDDDMIPSRIPSNKLGFPLAAVFRVSPNMDGRRPSFSPSIKTEYNLSVESDIHIESTELLKTDKDDLEMYKLYVKSSCNPPRFDNCAIIREIHDCLVVPDLDRDSNTPALYVDEESIGIYERYLTNTI